MRLPHAPGAPFLEVRHAARDERLARRLAAVARGFDPRIFESLPTGGADTLRLLLAADEGSFRRASGGRFPDWGLAVAFPASREIVMRSPRIVSGDTQDPGRVLVHELVHVYLALALGPAEHAAPRWLHEGLASLLAGEWGWSERVDMAVVLLSGRLLPLERLERSFPVDTKPAELAYLESLTAAAYLRDVWGERGLTLLLRNLRRHARFDTAVRATYGITYAEFEERWRQSIGRRFGWAAAAASSWTLWAPAAVLLALLAVMRRTRYRARLRALQRAEATAAEGQEWEGAAMGVDDPTPREADAQEDAVTSEDDADRQEAPRDR
ncbi:MAG: hypothetical protein H0V09_12205 [Gemmatimonadetes bacterium]|nr:hypothetical protein [Gemmatimonadota bacterium]